MNKLSKEDERLLDQYSKTVQTGSNHIIYGNAILVALVPIWYYWRIQEMDLAANSPLFGVIALAAAFLISMAYKSSKSTLVDQLALKRTPVITRQIKEDKKLNKKEQEECIRQTTKAVAEYESTTFAIFYINALFLMFFIIIASILSQITPQVNYVLTMVIASGLTVLLTKSSGKSHKH